MLFTNEPTVPRGAWVHLLCWIAVVLDGFDLVVLGALIPALTDGTAPFMTTAEATFVSTISLVGMTCGALTIGMATDRFGRRQVLIWTVASFSLFTLACAFAGSWLSLSAFRFLAGAGLGGCLPTAIAMVTEFSRGAAGKASTRVMTGYHVGALATALLAIVVLPLAGWRAMFVAGALPGFVLALAMWRWLPESPGWLAARAAKAEGGAAGANAGAAQLFRAPFLRNSLAVWATSFMGLLLVYGLNTWLPGLMISAGYDLQGGLWLLFVLNLGGILGLLISGAVGDRIGLQRASVLWFALGGGLLALMSLKLSAGLLYPLVFVTGAVVFSAQVLVYAWVAANHPPELRSTALGLSAGVGRLGAISGPLVGGVLVTLGLGHPWGFYVFALVGFAGALAALLLRRGPAAG